MLFIPRKLQLESISTQIGFHFIKRSLFCCETLLSLLETASDTCICKLVEQFEALVNVGSVMDSDTSFVIHKVSSCSLRSHIKNNLHLYSDLCNVNLKIPQLQPVPLSILTMHHWMKATKAV